MLDKKVTFFNNHKLRLVDLDFYKILFFSFLIGLSTILLLNILWLLILVPIVWYTFIKYGERIFAPLIIIALLTLTSTINVQLRTYVQYLSILILATLFFKNYGFDFINYPKIPREIRVILLFIFLSMFVSIIFSDYKLLGLTQVIRLSVFLIIVYSIYSLLHNKEDIKFIILALVIVLIVYSISIISEFIKSNYSIGELLQSQIQKVSSEYVNTNAIGSFLIITLSISVSFFFGSKNHQTKIIILLLLIIQSAILFLTNSRAAIFSTVISILFLYKYNGFLVRRIFSILLLLLPFFYIFHIYEIIEKYFRLNNLATGRNLIYEAVYYVIKENPILGVGPAATKYYLYHYLPYMLGGPQERFISFHYNEIEFGHAHNFFLFYWSDMGLLGLFTSILIPVMFFKLGIKAIQKTRKINSDYYLLALGIVAAGIGMFIRAFFEWGNIISYGSIVIDLPFWLMIILLSYIVNNKINENEYLVLKEYSKDKFNQSRLEKYL